MYVSERETEIGRHRQEREILHITYWHIFVLNLWGLFESHVFCCVLLWREWTMRLWTTPEQRRGHCPLLSSFTSSPPHCSVSSPLSMYPYLSNISSPSPCLEQDHSMSPGAYTWWLEPLQASGPKSILPHAENLYNEEERPKSRHVQNPWAFPSESPGHKPGLMGH